MHLTRIRPVHLLVGALLALFTLATAASASLRVTVQPGDTLGGIAARHGVSTESLVRANRIADADRLSIGRTLTVPGGLRRSSGSGGTGGGTYTVRPGDTVSGIALRFGVSVGAIVRLNGLDNAHVVIAGTRLRVGGGGGGASQQATWVGGSASSYTVRPGDTLSGIAARFGTSAQSLAAANGIANPNVVVVGTRLRVSGGGGGTTTQPVSSGSGGSYTVQPGDSLGAIAARFGTSAQSLAAANGIANPNVVVVGTRLRVPSGGSSAPTQGSRIRVTAATSGWGNQPSKSTVANLMARSAARHGVDVALVRAIGWQESGWFQGARSSTGAIGVMQLMPGTASWLGPYLLGREINPYDVSDNIEGGVAYLAYLQRQTGSRRLAIASYYQGLGSVTSRGLLAETEAYVRSVASFIGNV